MIWVFYCPLLPKHLFSWAGRPGRPLLSSLLGWTTGVVLTLKTPSSWTIDSLVAGDLNGDNLAEVVLSGLYSSQSTRGVVSIAYGSPRPGDCFIRGQHNQLLR